MTELADKLRVLEADKKRIESEIRALYKESLDAVPGGKLCADNLAEMLAEESPFQDS